jgi:predicted acetyltransferase
MEPVLRHPETDDELERCWEVIVRAFNFPRTDRERFFETMDRERALAVFVGDEVAAFSRIRPFGIYYGGRRIPMGGHSPVGTAPEFRGRGFGSMVTAGHFADLRERGEVLAALYPATTALYRGVGFGLAGVWAMHKLPTRSLQDIRPAGSVQIRRGSIADVPAVKECYRAWAPRQQGHLDRSDDWWDHNFLRGLDENRYLYVVDADRPGGGLAGYIHYRQSARPEWGYLMSVSEVVATSVDVAAALWRMIGSSSTMAPQTNVVGPPEHPLLLLLPEQDLEQVTTLRFMIRIVDLPGAFAARGYPPDLRLGADFELDDKDCPWNSGRWRLSIEGGQATAAKGGDGTIKVTPTALATLYSGYLSPHAMSAAGLLPGAGDRDLADLTAAFAGPTPWMPEIF